jgi:DNA polymerase II small subunit/DNA polymerase delta subunit B
LFDKIDKKMLEATYLEAGSFDKAAIKLGMNRKTFSRYYNQMVRHKTNKPVKTLIQYTDDILINQLQDRGYFVTKDAQQQDYLFQLDIDPFQGDRYRIGVVADTQLGSRYQQLTHLHSFYKHCQEENVNIVLHGGDLSDGQKMYKGHEYELFLHGADAQLDYCVNRYPEYDGIQTVFICGNHDESHYKIAQFDIGLHISRQRKDMIYKGFHGAYFEIAGITNLIYLHHASGGVAYARSYKTQKLIEQLSPDKKPFILLDGHFHVCNHLPMYRNVHAWQLPCFQSQTPYLVAKGLYPEIMGLIIEFTVVDGKPGKYVVEECPFYIPKKEDF